MIERRRDTGRAGRVGHLLRPEPPRDGVEHDVVRHRHRLLQVAARALRAVGVAQARAGVAVEHLAEPDRRDLLQGGQAVFAIAVGRQLRDVEGSLAHLPAERAQPGAEPPAVEQDELARRRRRTTA